MAVDFFLKLDTVHGEAKDSGMVDQIKVLSWSWGGSSTSSVHGTSGSGAGKVSLSDLSIMKDFDVASPKLLKGLTMGTHYKTATLTARKAGGGTTGTTFMTMDLTEVYITSYQTSGSSEVPTESVSFTYKSFSINYFQQKQDGTATNAGTASYDITTNVTS